MRYAVLLLFFAVPLSPLQSAAAQAPPKPPLLPLSESILARIPADYRAEAKAQIRQTEENQLQAENMPDGDLVATVLHLLGDIPSESTFLLDRLEKEPSAALRIDLIQALEKHWLGSSQDLPALEKHASSDPDVTVSVAAVKMLKEVGINSLNSLLKSRLGVALAAGDVHSAGLVLDEQKLLLQAHYGITLPSFMRIPPPQFSVVPAGRAIRVLAFGDFGTGSAAQKQTAAAMVAYQKIHPFDFGLTLGDNFYPRGMKSPDDPRWQTQWEQLYGVMHIPFYAVLGNHDWSGADSPAAEILYSARSQSWHMPSPYYTFTAGSVQFFAFDTPAMDEAELKWLDEELIRSTARWKVVFGHYHIYSATRGDNKELIARLLPILKKDHVDVYLDGHDHNLQELKPEGGVHFFVSGGGGAGLYEMNPYDRSVFRQKINGFTVLEADDKTLAISFVGTDGSEIYRRTLTK
uniref:Calcineurin-like phosphoesterase domain-containing protein n=2 Tax=Paracidobacterium acidisoli TaxID=2303751 RepID=A0A372IQD5_9BACT